MFHMARPSHNARTLDTHALREKGTGTHTGMLSSLTHLSAEHGSVIIESLAEPRTGRGAHEEGGRILALVALQLDDLAQLRVVDHGAVAAELCTAGTQIRLAGGRTCTI